MTNKSKGCNENITLKHNGKIINNPNDVCDIFNDYFTNVAREIGSEETLNEEEELDHIFKIYENHASIVGIQEHVTVNSPFQFTNVSVGEVKALLLDIDSTKATGYDTIPLNWSKRPQMNLLNQFLLWLICLYHCRVFLMN